MSDDLEQRLVAARQRVRELSRALSRDTVDALRTAWEDQLQAERALAAACGEQYALAIDIGPRWDTGALLPHLVSNGSRSNTRSARKPEREIGARPQDSCRSVARSKVQVQAAAQVTARWRGDCPPGGQHLPQVG